MYFKIKWNIIIFYINASFSWTHEIHLCYLELLRWIYGICLFDAKLGLLSPAENLHGSKIYMYVFSRIGIRLLADSTNLHRNHSPGVKYVSRYICTLWCSKFHCDSALNFIICSVIVYRYSARVTLHDR